MGINDTYNNHSQVEEEFISRFERNLKFKNGMYETKLFWDEKPDNLDDNFAVAKRRFDNLSIKMKENNWLYDEYKNIVKEQLNLKIVEECFSSNVSSYYMPHSAVVRSDRDTTKVRLVYDASSKAKGCKSLNDCLPAGPPLNPKILDIILQFRTHEYAFSGDIQGAFLTIGIAEEDRDYLRFIWFPDETESKSYKILRMTRVPFGVTSSPFILAATIKYHIKKYKHKQRETFEMLNSSLYVDDLFYGANTVHKALELSENAVEILKDSNMNLRKFKTNSNELRNLWHERGMAEAKGENERPLKVLGIIWNTEDDTFRLDVQPLLDMMNDLKNSKRSVLQTASKIFDPVGFASPFVVIIKLLMQEIWENGLSWDDELPAELKKKWEIWCSQIDLLKDLTIERKYFSCPLESANKFEMHIFCDASPRAFGAVAYFRYLSSDDNIYTSFITAKSRIAPLKRLTLPRLELMGAVVASRIFQYLKTTFRFSISKVYFWTDSLITLHWIKGTASKWKPFVQNRVSEIQSATDPANWHHCKGKDNPADYISRGATVEKLISSSAWLQGPEWLRLTKVEWPNGCNDEFLPDVSCERRIKLDEISTFVCEVQPKMTLLMDLNKYSSLRKLYRVTGWVLRFIHNIRDKNKRCNELSAEELDGAEKIWVKTIQEESFPGVIKCLKEKKTLPKESNLHQLNPLLSNEDILLVQGRLQKSNLPFQSKHPILLPTKHHLTTLIIRDSHERVLHAGVSSTLVQTREKFWILKGRQIVKSVLNKCIVCKRYNARAGQQAIAPLPGDRINEAPPFAVSGLDYAGPLYVKGSDDKHYILLFTCSVTRAVHLELVKGMATSEFLLAFRKFIARRGLCKIIYSDNAKTFKRAELELKQIWNAIHHPDVKKFYANHGITWKYITERAAWWGGFYERMVRSVKTALRKIIGKSSLILSELETLIIEVEAMVNCRPLTYIYSDADEPYPLTPAHFLLGRRITSLPVIKINDLNLPGTKEEFCKRFRLRENLLNHLWKRWKNEYLLALRSAHQTDQIKNYDFKINDIVLVKDEHLPRTFWKLGKITKLFPGRDGKIRSCELKTDSAIIKRPVQLLYRLELNE